MYDRVLSNTFSTELRSQCIWLCAEGFHGPRTDAWTSHGRDFGKTRGADGACQQDSNAADGDYIERMRRSYVVTVYTFI